MTYHKKQQLIRYLQTLKSLGFEYHEDVDLHLVDQDEENLSLPDNLNDLQEVVENCSLCELGKYSKNRFFSYGTSEAQLMLIGDFPSTDNFNPFAGQSGKMLSDICHNVLKIKEEQIYYTSILKCNLPASKEVHSDIVNCCTDYLIKQINIIQPQVVVIFDNATSQLLNTNKFTEDLTIISTYSPSFLLRNPSQKKQALEDFQKVKNILDKGIN